MAKALLGHVGIGSDLRLAAEIRRLRARVTELETEVGRAWAAHDTLLATLTVEDDIRILTEEPALT